MVILKDLLDRRVPGYKEPIELQIPAAVLAMSYITIPLHSCPGNGFQYHQALEQLRILPAS